jgi:PKD repeat protein
MSKKSASILSHCIILPYLLLALIACDGCDRLAIPILQAGVEGETLDTVNSVNDTIRMVNETIAGGIEVGPETRKVITSLIDQIERINSGGIKIDAALLATIQRAVEVVDKGLRIGLDDITLVTLTHFTDMIDKQPEKWGKELQALVGVLQMAGSDLARDIAKEVAQLSRRVTGDIASLGQTLGQEFRCTVDYTGQQVNQTLSTAGGRLVSGILSALRPKKGTTWVEPLRLPGICTIEPSEIKIVDVDGKLETADTMVVSISGFNFSGESMPEVLVRSEAKRIYQHIRLVPALNSSYKIEIPLQSIDFTGIEPRSRLVLAFRTNSGTVEFEKILIPVVPNPVIAEFEASPRQGEVPLTVQFHDRSHGNPETWLWDFGDTQQARTKDPVHKYERPGRFNVTLTVTNPKNTSTERKQSFVVVQPPSPPLAKAEGAPLSGRIPLTVHFLDRSTGNPSKLEWQFGDGSPISELINPSHIYRSPGRYRVELRAWDKYGGSTTTSLEVTAAAPPPAPVARFDASPREGRWPLEVSFYDRSQHAVEGTQWTWEFGDGAKSSEKSPRHRFERPGDYTISMHIRNENGENRASNVVRVLSRKGEQHTERIQSFGGHYGDWASEFASCPPNKFAYGFSDKVESKQGSDRNNGDDTALNGIKLWCADLPNTQSNSYISSNEQKWGLWSEIMDCGDRESYIIGARLRVESPQGDGDDTGGVDIEFLCSNDRHLSNGGYEWGEWKDWQYCPAHTAICGIRTRIEGERGSGWDTGRDDTALNDVEFTCCYVE